MVKVDLRHLTCFGFANKLFRWFDSMTIETKIYIGFDESACSPNKTNKAIF